MWRNWDPYGRTVKWGSHYGKTIWLFLRMLNIQSQLIQQVYL